MMLSSVWIDNILGEYTGEILPQGEVEASCERYLGAYSAALEGTGFVVDASKGGNILSLINDCRVRDEYGRVMYRKRCNVCLVWRLGRVYVMRIRNIEAGEELVINYWPQSLEQV